MSPGQEHADALKRILKKSADNDPMLQAYGRYWVPHIERIAIALEKIEAHLAILAGQVKSSADGKAGNDDK